MEDEVQRGRIRREIDERDWEFLRERNSTDTQEAANTATFLRNDGDSPLVSCCNLSELKRARTPDSMDSVCEEETADDDDGGRDEDEDF